VSEEPHFAGLAPQFLVDDLDVAMAFYRDVLGFAFGPP
jgi:predicted enzyme related to lactoylglutathione lyase